MLENGQEIAVKRLKTVSTQGGKEFKNEAEPLAKLNHCNLVQLCGYTIEGIERLLIYELLIHESLDKYIFDSSKSSILDREKLHNIIIDVASGLHYLHEGSRERICNVLYFCNSFCFIVIRILHFNLCSSETLIIMKIGFYIILV
ncbi:putative protein kinase RLK-Pelle-DLSV family [Helianthus anomalus]